MKKLLFFMLLCTAAFGFQACSSDDDSSSLPSTPENIMGEWLLVDEDKYETIWVIENSTGCVETYADGELEGIQPFSYTIDGNNITFIWEDGERTTIKLADIRENSLVFEKDGETVTFIRRGSNEDGIENGDEDKEEESEGSNVSSIYGSWKYEWGDPNGEHVIYHLGDDGTGYTQVMNSSFSPEDAIQHFTFTIKGNIIIITGGSVSKIEIISIKGNKATLLINDEMPAEMTRIYYEG